MRNRANCSHSGDDVNDTLVQLQYTLGDGANDPLSGQIYSPPSLPQLITNFIFPSNRYIACTSPIGCILYLWIECRISTWKDEIAFVRSIFRVEGFKHFS